MAWTLDQWRATGQAFGHRGHEVFWREGGRGGPGPVLLCIHGFPTASWDWNRVWPALCDRFARVVAADMIGFGFSAKPADHDYSILDQADLHEGLLTHLGVSRCHLLAHDYGDTVAQELLARHEERAGAGLRIESCVFLNGGLFPETHRPRAIQRLLASPVGPLLALLTGERQFSRSLSAVFGANSKPHARELHEFWQLVAHNRGPRVFPRLIRYMRERRDHRERWVGALQKTAVPLRLIDGAEDPISGAHMVARYRELVPHPDCVTLPGIGHYPQVEDPAGVLRAFWEFHA